MSKQLNYTGSMSMNTSKLMQALKEVNASLKESTAQLNYFKESGKSSSEIIDAYTQKIEDHSKKVEILSKKYEELKQKYGENATKTKNAKTELENAQTALAKTQNGLESYKNEVDKATKAQDSMCNSITPLKQVLIDFAENVVSKATTALVNFTKDTVNTGMNFETSFANVKKAVSGSTEEMQALEKEIRQTAMEKPISADTLASLYQMGGQLGIAREDLKDFTTAMVDLQNTSDLTAESGATMIAQYANVTGLKSEDYSRFASTLSYLGSTTATTESTIMNLVSRISGAGNQIGMTHQQILALSTAMGSVGINAEAGGSAISTIMSNIDIAVDKNSDDLKTWAETAKMSSTEFASLWKTDVMSALQAVIKGMSDTKAEGGSLNILLSDLGISNIRQLDTMKKLAGASDLLNECVEKANTEWKENQFLTSATADAYNTLESKTLILQNTFKELQISIYDNLKEPLKEAATELTNFLKTEDVKKFGTEFSNILSSLAKTAVSAIKWIVTNFDGISKAIQAIIPVIATLIARFAILKAYNFYTTIVKGFNSIKTAIEAGNLATKIFSGTLAATPVGLIATGIAVAVTAIGSLCIKLNEARNGLSEVQKQIQETNAEREKALSGIDSEYNKYDSLVTELKTLVDENGNVKTGYEDRVNTIIPLLEQATGTEIQLINNQIVGYKDLMNTLDDVIEKKRMQAKINAYQSDYEEALKNEDELAKKKEEALKKVEEAQKEAGYSPKSMQILENAKNELKDIEAQIEDNTKVQEKYNSLVKEQYEYEQKAKEKQNEDNNSAGSNGNKNSSGSNSGAGSEDSSSESKTLTYQELLKQQTTYQAQVDKYRELIKSGSEEITYEMLEQAQKSLSEVESKIKNIEGDSSSSKSSSKTATKTSSKATTEESNTTYQELLNQQKAYKEQLTSYVNAMKSGNSEVTVEMVQDTQKNLTAVEKKIKSLQELMGSAVTDITNKATTAATKIVDLKVDNDSEDEISEDDELDNENHISSGVILSKGVVGDNAVELQGGKDAATAYLNGYLQQQQEQADALNEAINTQAINRVASETLSYQTATLDPENIAKYDLTERQVANQKEQSQATGMIDYSYLVTNASTAVMNLAKQAAMQVDFEPIGLYICQGIVRGIENNKYMVIDAVRAMMEEANEAAADAEEEHSPSKVFYRFGKYIDMGLANGIRDYANDVSGQVETMAKNLQTSVAGLNTNLSSAKLNAGATFGNSGTTNINYNFTQTNNSNKSLDTLAIYQESKSMLKRAIRNVYV